MLFKHNLIFFLSILFASYCSSKVSVEVCATFMAHPPPCARDSAKRFGDLTGHLQDRTLTTYTKDCNSTERLGRQKARQLTAKGTTLIRVSLKTGKWIETITSKVNFLIASILSLQMWVPVKFSRVLTFICYCSISYTEKQESYFSGVSCSILNAEPMPERVNPGFQDLINHLDCAHISKISKRNRHNLEYTFWKEFLFQLHTNTHITFLSWLLLWEVLVIITT